MLEGMSYTQMDCFLKIYPQHKSMLNWKNYNHNIQIDANENQMKMMQDW